MRTLKILLVVAVLSLLAGVGGGGVASATAGTAGMYSPSYGFITTIQGVQFTAADDNVTDTHCVYVKYVQAGVTRTDGAYSCGSVVYKQHGAVFIYDGRACLTFHGVCVY